MKHEQLDRTVERLLPQIRRSSGRTVEIGETLAFVETRQRLFELGDPRVAGIGSGPHERPCTPDRARRRCPTTVIDALHDGDRPVFTREDERSSTIRALSSRTSGRPATPLRRSGRANRRGSGWSSGETPPATTSRSAATLTRSMSTAKGLEDPAVRRHRRLGTIDRQRVGRRVDRRRLQATSRALPQERRALGKGTLALRHPQIKWAHWQRPEVKRLRLDRRTDRRGRRSALSRKSASPTYGITEAPPQSSSGSNERGARIDQEFHVHHAVDDAAARRRRR